MKWSLRESLLVVTIVALIVPYLAPLVKPEPPPPKLSYFLPLSEPPPLTPDQQALNKHIPELPFFFEDSAITYSTKRAIVDAIAYRTNDESIISIDRVGGTTYEKLNQLHGRYSCELDLEPVWHPAIKDELSRKFHELAAGKGFRTSSTGGSHLFLKRGESNFLIWIEFQRGSQLVVSIYGWLDGDLPGA